MEEQHGDPAKDVFAVDPRRTGRIRRWVAGAIAAQAVLAGCGGTEAHADSPGSVASWTVSPTPEVSIGLMDGDSAYLFQSIRSAHWLGDGSIAVADGRLDVVRVYDAHGAFLHQMGGKGDGPGEFRSIGGMWIAPPDTIGLWDPESLRFTTFLADGTMADSRTLVISSRTPPGVFDLFVGHLSDGSTVVGSTRAGRASTPREVVADRVTTARFAPDGTFDNMVGEVAGLRREGGRIPVTFSPLPWTGVYHDSIYFADGSRPEITVRGPDGTAGRTVRVPLTTPDPSGARAAYDAEVQAYGDPMAGMVKPDEQAWADSVPFFARMLVADDGHIWVKAYDPAADALGLRQRASTRPGIWKVLANDGTLVADVRSPGSLSPMEIRGDRMLAVAVDSLGIQRVQVRRILGMDAPTPARGTK